MANSCACILDNVADQDWEGDLGEPNAESLAALAEARLGLGETCDSVEELLDALEDEEVDS